MDRENVALNTKPEEDLTSEPTQGCKKFGKHEKVKIMKNEIKFLISKNKQLEEKLKVNEGKTDCQFDHIVKLEDKCKKFKEKLDPQGTGKKQTTSTTRENKVLKECEECKQWKTKHDVLLHSKESNSRKFSNFKSGQERKIKSLKDHITALEEEVKAKELENKLQALKHKDMLRKLNDEQISNNIIARQARETTRLVSRESTSSVVRSKKSTSNIQNSCRKQRSTSIKPFVYNSKQRKKEVGRPRNQYRLILRLS